MFPRLKEKAGQIGQAGGSENEPSSQDQSLATVLPTPEDRANLMLLVANSMEAMRTQILDTFDAMKTGGNSDDPKSVKLEPTTEQIDKPLEVVVSADKPTEEPDTGVLPVQGDPEQQQDEKASSKDDAAKELEKRKRELAKPANVACFQACLQHFDQWRDKVMQRIGEALNEHIEEEQKEKSHINMNQAKASTSTHKTKAISEDCTWLSQVYPPLGTPLRQLDEPLRILILHSLLLLLLSLETYQAESRALLLRIISSLQLSPRILAHDEASVAHGLLEAAGQQMNADAEAKNKQEQSTIARRWKVGLGAAAGAILIGVTGGLAAPLIAAGIGSMMGGLGLGATVTAGYLGALAGSAPLVGVLFGAYGAKMTGQMIDEYAKQVEDFAFIPVHPDSTSQESGSESASRHLRVAIAISGWLSEEKEVVTPWQIFTGESSETFALRWELKSLLGLGSALKTYATSYAWSWAQSEFLKHTILATLTAAIALPYGLAKASRVIDNPFSVAKSRSDKAGAVLADALINKVQGERPVTLIGYSLGSRVIFSCLIELANRRAFGLVESVCLLGAPVPSDEMDWRRIRSVVAGRVVNVYSTKDSLLAFLYRASSLQYGVAGLQAVRNVCGIENVDITGFLSGHTQYCFLVGSILKKVDLEGIDHELVEQQMEKARDEELKMEKQREKNKAEASVEDKEALAKEQDDAA